GELREDDGTPVSVRLALGDHELLGTTTVHPSGGLATFDDLVIAPPGRGFKLVASAEGFSDITSGPFHYEQPPVPSPSGLIATEGEHEGLVALLWEPVEGATGYRVYRDGEPVGTTTSAFYEDTGAEPGPAPPKVAGFSATL